MCPKWCCLSTNHHQGSQPCQRRVCPKQCHLSVNPHQGSWPCHISKQYNHQGSPWGGESLLPPPPDKTTPVGGASSQDRGRSNMRGWGGSSQSISHPRGEQDKVSVQLPHQEGDLPSGLTPSVPPPPAPERTQPQWGGRPRSTLCDPMQLAAKFHSSGWRKDLEHILWVYYKFSVASFREAEWVRVKERFFNHFLQYKEEALALKEARPIDFMAYIQDLFYQATGLHLDGLRSFTGWNKWGAIIMD